MRLKIKITKEVLEATKMCGKSKFKLPDSKNYNIIDNCAVTYACRKLFPKCKTSTISIMTINKYGKVVIIANLPVSVSNFIDKFDKYSPEARVKMKPFEFEVELTKEALDLITIDEITEVLKESTTLEVV